MEVSRPLDTNGYGKGTAVLDFIKYIKDKLASVRVKNENRVPRSVRVVVSEYDPLGPLPEGWEIRVFNQDSIYFANLKSKTTQWEDPRTHGSENPLPPGWIVKHTHGSPMVYFDQNTNTCTSVDPRQVYNAGPEGTFNPVPKYLKLKWKLADFHSLCECNKEPSTIKITLTRESLFKDSFSQIMKIPPHQLRGELLITFNGEGELDNEDVVNEWIDLLFSEVLNPKFGLFEYADKYENSVELNSACVANRNNLKYFRFIGRIIAMALFHGKFIHKRFTIPFYKQILGKKLGMKDIEFIDSEFYSSLLWIEENNIEECGLELFFSVNFKIRGRLRSHDLKKGGSKIKVTEKNKKKFLRLMTDWKLSRGHKRQMESFLSGFNEVFPSQWLHYFDEMEFENMLCGSQKPIDLEDWQAHTIYRNCPEKYIKGFWKYVYQLDYERQARLLQFVTGTHTVPVGGFAYLMGSDGPQYFCIEIAWNETELPRSHPSINRLELPPYRSYVHFEANMTYALEKFMGLKQSCRFKRG